MRLLALALLALVLGSLVGVPSTSSASASPTSGNLVPGGLIESDDAVGSRVARYAYDSSAASTTPSANPRTAARLARPAPARDSRSSTPFSAGRSAAKGARGVDQGFAVGAGFRSFSQAKRVLGPAGEGKQWHHLVEQTPGNVGRFGPEAVHNTGNLVRLDTAVHRQVSGYYSSKQPFTGGQTVRQWLGGQSYARQQQFSRQILDRFGG